MPGISGSALLRKPHFTAVLARLQWHGGLQGSTVAAGAPIRGQSTDPKLPKRALAVGEAYC
jgi:hypothetical protein